MIHKKEKISNTEKEDIKKLNIQTEIQKFRDIKIFIYFVNCK